DVRPGDVVAVPTQPAQRFDATRFLHTKAGTYELFLRLPRGGRQPCCFTLGVEMLLQRICRQLDSRLWNPKNFEAHLAGVPEYALAVVGEMLVQTQPRKAPTQHKFCILLLNTQCEEDADEIGATSISFRPKVFSDPASVVD